MVLQTGFRLFCDALVPLKSPMILASALESFSTSSSVFRLAAVTSCTADGVVVAPYLIPSNLLAGRCCVMV